jgi:S1-C subfamily serine protease
MSHAERRPICLYVGKVHAVNGSADICQPDIVKETDDISSGTVFFVTGESIGLSKYPGVVGITNAHCVESMLRKTCRVMQDGITIGDFDVVHVCFTLDFAILKPRTRVSVETCTISQDVIAPGTPVSIPGYPLDCDTCQVAHGCVSDHGSNHWIHCNLASNFGNSGGPLVSHTNNHVYGIVTQSPAHSESITEVIPTWIVKKCITRWAGVDIVIHVPTMHIVSHPLTKHAARFYSVGSNTPGCIVQESKVPNVHQDDVITEFTDNDGHRWPVCEESTQVMTSLCGKADIDSHALLLQLPDKFNVVLHRRGIEGSVVVECDMAHIEANQSPPIDYKPCWENIPIVRTKGVVITALSHALLNLFEGYDSSELLRYAWHTLDLSTNSQPPAVVSFVTPHSHAADSGIQALMILTSVNRKPIRGIEDAIRALKPKHIPSRTRLSKLEFNHGKHTAIVDATLV